jgi:hypothetical protein
LIEAVSAGCLALAPTHCVWGFPELLTPELEFSSMDRLLEIVRALERDPGLFKRLRDQQERLVDEWCFMNPAQNLEAMMHVFRSSSPKPGRQRRAEIRSHVAAAGALTAQRVVRRARRELKRRRVAIGDPEAHGGDGARAG